MICHCFFTIVYLVIKQFYNCVYFYFFPFAIIILPLTFVLIEKTFADDDVMR